MLEKGTIPEEYRETALKNYEKLPSEYRVRVKYALENQANVLRAIETGILGIAAVSLYTGMHKYYSFLSPEARKLVFETKKMIKKVHDGEIENLEFEELIRRASEGEVVPPDEISEGYNVDLDKKVQNYLQLDNKEDLAVLVTMRVDGEDVIANFQGPLLINAGTRKGVQVVLENTEKTFEKIG